MKWGKSYIKDSRVSSEKLKKLGKVQSNAILLTANVIGRFFGLKAMYEKLEEREAK